MAGATKTQQTPAAKSPATPKPAPTKAAAPTASPARDLQQRVGNQGAQALMQKKGGGVRQGAKKNAGLPESSELVDLSSGTFNPSQKVQDEIKASPRGLLVRVAAKGIASEGRVKIKADAKGVFRSESVGSMPLLGEWPQMLGGLYLNIDVTGGKVTGSASLKPEAAPSKDWLKMLQDNVTLLGGAGLKVEKLPTPVNKFENGKLILGVKKLPVEVGGFLTSEFSIESVNGAKPTVDASAKVKIGGAAEGDLSMSNAAGALQGQVTLAVTFSSFSGSVLVKYNPEGTVDIGGKAAYNADKLSGEIEFIATDVDAANKFAKDAIAAAGGLENVQQAPGAPPVPAPKPDNKKRALAASGILTFNLTQWFAGTVNVVVDGKGQITVIGRIAPPAEIELFAQKDWNKPLVSFEAKAYYGIPVVGNLNLFAKISLNAIAKLGPAKIYNIEVLGTYSTDPTVQKNIQIAGSINISAYAGLRLRAEGGAGIEILDHDLKFGIGVNADVGVKAYAEARPTLGFREPGEFYMSGTLEMVAQPMLGLSGDFFIEIDTPWWSPLSDDKWIWPLFSKEWPLTDPIGINASIKNYVLGSGKVPEIEVKPPEFDPSKFMTNMVDDKLPGKSGKGETGQGTFKEDGSVQKTVVEDKKKGNEKKKTGGDKNQTKGPGKSLNKDTNADASASAAKDLKNGLDALKSKESYSKPELVKALGALKKKVSGVLFNHKLEGDKWIVTAGANKKKKNAGQSIELKAKKEGAVSAEGQKGLTALDEITARYSAQGAGFEELTKAIVPIKQQYGFKTLTVAQKSGVWQYKYEAPAKGTRKGPKVVENEKTSRLGRAKQFVKDKAKAVVEKGKAILEWWKKRTKFKAGGESHELYFAGTEKSPQLTVASTPKLVNTFVKKAKEELKKSVDPNKAAKEAAIVIIEAQLGIMKAELDKKPIETQVQKVITDAFTMIGNNLPILMDLDLNDNAVVTKFTLERTDFSPETSKSLVVKSDEGRRHIVSSRDIAEHFENCLGEKNVSYAANLLLARGQPVKKPLSSDAIQKAAKERYKRFFSDLHNLFAGNQSRNSSIGRKLDPDKPGMDTEEKIQEHIQYIKNRWSLIPEELKISRLP